MKFDEEIKNPSLYSTDENLQRKAVGTALINTYKPLLDAGVLLNKSIPAHTETIMELIKQGVDPATAIEQEFTAPLMAKQEVADYRTAQSEKQNLATQKAQAELAQTQAQTEKIKRDIASGDVSYSKIGTDADGNDIY